MILPKYHFSLNIIYHWKKFLFYSYKINKVWQPKPDNFFILPYFKHFYIISKYLYFLFKWHPQEYLCNIHENIEIVKRRICLLKKGNEKNCEEGLNPKLTVGSDIQVIVILEKLLNGLFEAYNSWGPYGNSWWFSFFLTISGSGQYTFFLGQSLFFRFL